MIVYKQLIKNCNNYFINILINDFNLYYITGKFEYYCPNDCGKKYNRKHNLNRHLNYECGVERRFTCDICFKKFTYKNSMKFHKISVHRIITSDSDGNNSILINNLI